jgi:flagellar hook-associated protein 1 FlgK
MGLTNALNAANAGRHVTQSGLAVVANNIANVNTDGYSRRIHTQENIVAHGESIGVRDTEAVRIVDAFLQKQLRTETTLSQNVDTRHQYMQRVDQLFGEPGSSNALDTVINDLNDSFQQLTTSPESYTSRELAVSQAETFTQKLNSLSSGIQGLRQLAEDAIDEAVTDLNDALKQLVSINDKLTATSGSLRPSADLLDQRDGFIDTIAELMDVRVTTDKEGRASIFSQGGNTLLLSGAAAEFRFDKNDNISARSLYNSDESLRGVGTIKLHGAANNNIDLLANGSMNTGKIGALVELRDETLTRVQDQLDELAHGMAQSLANRNIAGEAVTSGAQTGFDVDTSHMLSGNSITLAYTEGGVDKNVSIIRVDDAASLPLSDDVTPNPDDRVIGADFSAGLAAVAAAIDAELGAGVAVSVNGSSLRFLDDGVAGTVDINSASAEVTSTAMQGEGKQLALFVDGGGSPATYSNVLDGEGQKLGFAERITVSSQVKANNEYLVKYASTTEAGDQSRPLELADRLNSWSFDFSPKTGIGSSSNPFSGSATDFARKVISFQTGLADKVSREQASQEAVFGALESKYESAVGVDIDEELAELIKLQNSFSANARVIQAVSEMMDTLMSI